MVHTGISYSNQMTTPATAKDFQRWEQDAQSLDLEELLHIVQDCRRAEEAMRGWNPIKEGYYSDQASTYGQEYTKRVRGAK